ncbi:hypothetical protein MKUB_43520 [Mycobacterium kubicae]|uniref:Membrane protein ArfB n=1 Tax=Mycobacterium kubicae TaxID=120959 RepID=A0AAX1JHM9_9MYCO|nr:hypothetical protein [Mycobacterium kubicae]MCV7097742.1 hypothetical protein [Mycobacterium kubicae]ORV94431.1 hypothetical protein AWC13_22635 [Mycobacterium kubicae]QNI13553.1 hypothetical protein GAN18_22475 [Mycobacterium kubicae]QPI41034.1 hypothetical protein I2456_22055 [Mycobacterium kubicae]GFG66862.1 hypothetical protein MKUB_43520 [Mycobacterium kubicae]
MDFLLQWLCYLVAFAAGSGVAWGIVTVVFNRMSAGATTADMTVADDSPTEVLPTQLGAP